MAFNKVSMVFIVLLVSATIANARLFESESAGIEPKFCSSCECREESGTTKCYRTDRKFGSCPVRCGTGTHCLCNRREPPTCWCRYEVDTCTPIECPVSTATNLVDVLGLSGNY